MNMQVLGLIAGCFTTVAFVPQVIKTIREKHARGLSWGMTIIYFTGVILWFVYGLMRGDMPILISNAVAVCLNAVLVFFKIKYSRKN